MRPSLMIFVLSPNVVRRKRRKGLHVRTHKKALDSYIFIFQSLMIPYTFEVLYEWRFRDQLKTSGFEYDPILYWKETFKAAQLQFKTSK